MPAEGQDIAEVDAAKTGVLKLFSTVHHGTAAYDAYFSHKRRHGEISFSTLYTIKKLRPQHIISHITPLSIVCHLIKCTTQKKQRRLPPACPAALCGAISAKFVLVCFAGN
jgi:hypothetical protein